MSRSMNWWLAGALVCATLAPARAELDAADLNISRNVREGDWLRLRLEVLGLRLSYPAYRIHLELDLANDIAFTFSAGSGMAQHLEEAGAAEAEEMMAYHARGIRQQVSDLVQNEFPELWPRFSAAEDFRGQFLVPGEDWDSPPQQLAQWREDRLIWSR